MSALWPTSGFRSLGMEEEDMETYSESFSMWVLQPEEDWKENMNQDHDCIKE